MQKFEKEVFMMKKYMKWLWGTMAVLAGVGGLSWLLLGGLNVDLVSAFGAGKRLVEILAGISGVAISLRYFWK